VHANIYGCSTAMADKRNEAHLELFLDGTALADCWRERLIVGDANKNERATSFQAYV
jgi:hypothetical protein